MEFVKKFVCEDVEFSTHEKNIPSPVFRKSFVLESAAESAEILISGLGFYDLFINGKKITKGYLAPYITNSDYIVYYDRYDIKEYLTCGENVIGIMLGDNGHITGKTPIWEYMTNDIASAPMLALNAEIKTQNETVTFEADDFVCKKGPVIFNNMRWGTFYDARLEEDGWNMPGFEEKGWHKPVYVINQPRGYAKLCEAEPIKVYREIKPVSVKKGGLVEYVPGEGARRNFAKLNLFETDPKRDGGYIYDFGENNAGIFRLKIKGTRGQKVSLQFGEQLTGGRLNYNMMVSYPPGFAQRDIYYLKGDDEEIFEPMFTYHGYRYVYVSGITEEQATEGLLTYLVMSSQLEDRGSFECSDDTVNALYDMGRRSDISNMFYIPTDCPTREKNGWTGDAAASAEHMILTLGVEKSWREWLNNIRESQRSDGKLPGVVPTDCYGYDWGNGPAWDRVIFDLPYYAYKYRGDTEIIKENASAMLRYLEYVSKTRDEKGIVEIGLGDWLPVQRKRQPNEPFHKDELGFTDSVMVLDMCRKGAEMFEQVNLPLHKAFAEQLADEMYTAIRREFIDFDTYIVKKKSQTLQAMAIFYDVFSEDEKQKAFDVLMEVIREDDYSITSGFLGMRVIFHVLSQFGEADLAYDMITKKEYPSYGYWVEKGETTLLECFCEYEDNFPVSKNHHFFGDIINWFISSLGGIKVQNADEVIINPSFVKKLDWCRASHKLPRGEVKVSWRRIKEGIELKTEVSGTVKYRVECGELQKDGTYIIK